MITNDLDLGFAKIRVTVNNTAINFEVEKSSFDTYQLDDGTELHPVGCLEIIINTLPYCIGDKISVGFDRGAFTCDSGGESRINIVGEIREFTVAMGAPDTDAAGSLKRTFPYETWCSDSRGFEFHITDDPEQYSKNSVDIVITVVWEYSNLDCAWDMVSYLTS